MLQKRNDRIDLVPHYWIKTLLCLSYIIDVSYGGYQSHKDVHNSLHNGVTHNPLNSLFHLKWSEPYFDTAMPKNVTALSGKSAYLSCRVKNLGNKTVSWIRHRDLHILTVATYTYTTDQRFQTTHHKTTDEWTLQIKWSQPRDAGMYECQVSSQPIKSFFVNLNVADRNDVENGYFGSLFREYNDEYRSLSGRLPSHHHQPQYNPWDNFQFSPQNGLNYPNDSNGRMFSDRFYVPTASIIGSPDLFVDKGSTINLTCVIRYSPEPPAYIFWYHRDEVISYDSARGGISIITSKGEPTVSYLLIQGAELDDSGKYSCSPSNTDVVSIRVHVLNGERLEAMQTGAAVINMGKTLWIYLFITLFTCVLNQFSIVSHFIENINLLHTQPHLVVR